MNTFSAKLRVIVTIVRFLSLLTVVITVGCMSDEDTAGIGGTGEPVRVSVVGGAGVGTVTGFGSIFINDDRRFEVTSETQFIIDDDVLSEAEFKQRGVGFVAHFSVGEDVTDDMTGGTAVSVEAENIVKGPVTGTTPLTVMGVPVVVTADTVLINVPDNDIDNLTSGDTVEVSGYLGQGGIDATRLEYKSAGILEWELNGYVGNYIANTSFSIGTQAIELNGVVPEDCDTGLANGLLVEVKATPDTDLTTLDTVISVECKQAGLRVPDNTGDNEIEAEIEGAVSALNPPDVIVMHGQTVKYSTSTVFEGGTLDDITVGTRVEAQGTLNIDSGILMADKIRLRQTLLRVEAPAYVGDVNTTDQSLQILGATIQANALTRDDDGIFSGGLLTDRQVEILGIVDGGGTVFVTEIKDIGNPDSGRIRIRGPVTDLSNPSFEITGIVVDTSTAQELEGDTQFFNLIGNGTPVRVEDGVYDPGTGVVNNAKISIEN